MIYLHTKFIFTINPGVQLLFIKLGMRFVPNVFGMRYQKIHRYLLNIFNVKHLLLSEFQPDSSYWILMLFYALYSVLERKNDHFILSLFFYDKFYLLVNAFRWKKKVPEINISVILSLHNCFTNHTA